MIKKLMILCLSLSCLVACETKNDLEPDDTKLVQVKFKVESLDVSVKPISKSSVSASSTLTNIMYSIRKRNARSGIDKSQTIEQAGESFGYIEEWMPAGTYDIEFFGYGESNTDGSAFMRRDYDYNETIIIVKNKDSFYMGKKEVVIGDEANQVDVNLSRINSRLVVRLNDEVPSDIKKIKLSMYYYPIIDPESGKLDTEGNDGRATLVEKELTIENGRVKEFDFYLLPQSGSNLSFTIYDAGNATLGTCTVPVTFYENRQTIVEGNLLDIINQKPFNVTVTTEWGEDVNVPLQ